MTTRGGVPESRPRVISSALLLPGGLRGWLLLVVAAAVWVSEERREA